MSLIDDLRALVGKYGEPPFPKEWAEYPENGEEGKRRIIEAIIAREPMPEFVPKGLDSFPVYFTAGPFKPEPHNSNGWCKTGYALGWLEVIEAIIEARIKEALKDAR